MRTHLLAAAAAAALSVSLSNTAFASCESGEIVVKFAHVVAATGSPKGETATALAERVNDEMNGSLCMEVYPNSQLYDDDKVLEAMLLGDVQLAAPSLSKFEKYTKKFRIFDLPFLFEDIDAVDRFQSDEAGQELLESMVGNGLLGLGYWHNGMKQISANKPLLTPEDAAGLKFRIQTSDVLEAQFRALDSNPQKLAFSEVYGALQTGVVDGQENPPSNIILQRFYQVQGHMTETQHVMTVGAVITNEEWWQSLSEADRQAILAADAEASLAHDGIGVVQDLLGVQKIRDEGVEVHTPGPEHMEAFRAATIEPTKAWAVEQFGAEFVDDFFAHMASFDAQF